MLDFDSDIYLTGSNAHMLSGDLATHLGGRYVEIKIYPFSFAEVMETEQEQQRGNEAESFLQYVQGGEMPFLYDYGLQNEVRDKYLSDVFDSIILKDITQRYAVRDNFPKFVVSMDEINRSRNGIRHMNVHSFLLSGLKAAGATF